jgi:hypothetical protein
MGVVADVVEQHAEPDVVEMPLEEIKPRIPETKPLPPTSKKKSHL